MLLIYDAHVKTESIHMAYVDRFVMPLPKRNRQACRSMQLEPSSRGWQDVAICITRAPAARPGAF